MYNIAPVGDLDRGRRVHRSLLKLRTQRDPDLVVPVRDSPVEQTPPLEVEEQEGDLFLLAPETLPGLSGQGSSDYQSPPGPSARVMQPGIFDASHVVEVAAQPQPELVSAAPSVEDGMLRRSQRATAGQHSNVYRLPQSLEENAVVTMPQVSNSVSAIFRPWD